ncbi:MAG: DUF6544 family protein [Actinomycetota bacterium]
MVTTAQAVWDSLERVGDGPLQSFDPATTVDLPEPAQRFLCAAIPSATPLSTGIQLEMNGQIKLGMWLPFTARQLLRASVGLVWAAEVGDRLLRFTGADTLDTSGARMRFALFGRVPVVNATGQDVERSAAGRLAAETAAWLPQALTPQAGARWTAVDESQARVTLPGPAGPVDVDLTIDERGHIVDLGLERWNTTAKPPRAEPFGGAITDALDVHGVTIAGAGSVGWGHGVAHHDDTAFFRYRVTTAHFLDEAAHGQPRRR